MKSVHYPGGTERFEREPSKRSARSGVQHFLMTTTTTTPCGENDEEGTLNVVFWDSFQAIQPSVVLPTLRAQV